jgi:hypothetical protein
MGLRWGKNDTSSLLRVLQAAGEPAMMR